MVGRRAGLRPDSFTPNWTEYPHTSARPPEAHIALLNSAQLTVIDAIRIRSKNPLGTLEELAARMLRMYIDRATSG